MSSTNGVRSLGVLDAHSGGWTMGDIRSFHVRIMQRKVSFFPFPHQVSGLSSSLLRKRLGLAILEYGLLGVSLWVLTLK